MDVDQQRTCKKSYIHIVLFKHVVRLNYFRIIVLCQWFTDGGIFPQKNSGQPIATLFLFIYLFIFWSCHAACEILVPQPGIELMSPVLKAWSLKHWMIREVPVATLLATTLGCYWHLVSRSQENHSTSFKAQDSPPYKN